MWYLTFFSLSEDIAWALQMIAQRESQIKLSISLMCTCSYWKISLEAKRELSSWGLSLFLKWWCSEFNLSSLPFFFNKWLSAETAKIPKASGREQNKKRLLNFDITKHASCCLTRWAAALDATLQKWLEMHQLVLLNGITWISYCPLRPILDP